MPKTGVHYHHEDGEMIAITLFGETAKEYIEISSQLSRLAERARKVSQDATHSKEEVRSILKEK